MKYLFYATFVASILLNLLFFVIIRKAVNNRKTIEKKE